MKRLIKRNKKLLLELGIIFGLLLVVAGISFLVLTLFDVIYFDSENAIRFNPELFSSFTNSWYGWIIFILFQTVVTMLLCIVPGISMAFIVLCKTTIYTEPWQAFLVSFISVMISSITMYLLGRFGGYRLTERLIGKEECERAMPLLGERTSIFFPLMMMFPFFPDDALVMLAGTIRMKLTWFIPSIVVGRGVGIAAIVFGISLIPFETFTTFYDWLVFITVCVVWVFIVFFLANKLNLRIRWAREAEAEEQARRERESSEVK